MDPIQPEKADLLRAVHAGCDLQIPAFFLTQSNSNMHIVVLVRSADKSGSMPMPNDDADQT